MDALFPLTNPVWITFAILILVLSVPILMQKIHLPQIAGLIVAGIIVGNGGLGIIESSSTKLSFCGQLGMIFIMFFAGLEIDLEEVKKSKLWGLIFGISTFIIPGMLCYFACRHLLGMNNTISIITSCILGSQTLIAYPTIRRYGLSKLPVVTIAVIGALIAITAALVIFSITQASVKGDGSFNPPLFLATCTVYIAAIIFLYPRLTRLFFKHVKNSFYHFLFIMILLALCAGLAQFIGLEAIIGSFLAGIVLGRYIQGNQTLTNRIDFVGNTFFVPYFLLNTGMMIDPEVFIEDLDIIKIFGVLFLTCTLGKWIVSWVMQLLLKEDKQTRRILFGLSEAHAAGAFAISFICIKLELMDHTTFCAIVLVVLFSCILSTLVTEYAAYSIHKIRLNSIPAEKLEDKMLVHYTNHHSVGSTTDIINAIKNDKTQVAGIHVTINGEHANSFLKTGQEILNMAINAAAESELNIVTHNRLGNNINDSIINTANEFGATLIQLRLPTPSQINNHFYSNFIEPFIHSYSKELLFARVAIPLNTIRGIYVTIPAPIQPNIFCKNGVRLLVNLCRYIQCRIEFYSDDTTLNYIHNYADSFGIQKAHYYPINNIQDIDFEISQLNNDKLIVLWGDRTEDVNLRNDDYTKIFSQIQYMPEDSNIMLFYPQCDLSQIESFVNNKTVSHRTDGDLLKILRM